MLQWLWKNWFATCKVKYVNGKYYTCKIYSANCYFGTCIATWKEENDTGKQFHYMPVFFFNDSKHAKRCIKDEILESKDFTFYLERVKDKYHLSEIKQVAKMLINQGIKVTFKKKKKHGSRR